MGMVTERQEWRLEEVEIAARDLERAEEMLELARKTLHKRVHEAFWGQCSMPSIASAIGVSRQRVHQILNEHR